MSKAARIRALYARGYTTAQIAECCGCRIEYVRVCARQRVPGGSAHGERAAARQRLNYWRNPDRHREYQRELYARQRDQSAA